VDRPGHEADHSRPSTSEVKTGGSIPPLAHTSSWRFAKLIMYSDKFYLYQRLWMVAVLTLFQIGTQSEYLSGRSENKHAKPHSGQTVSGPGSREDGPGMTSCIYVDMQLIDLNVHSPRCCVELIGNDQNIIKLLVIHNQTCFNESSNHRIMTIMSKKRWEH
jgi:hypothetical protein